MSTNYQIGIGNTHTDPSVLIYGHWDGYPDSVLPNILPFLNKFEEHRGISDYQYCAARLLQHLMKDDLDGYLGFGISEDFAIGIEFYYFITNAEVRVYEVSGSELNLLKKVPIDKNNKFD